MGWGQKERAQQAMSVAVRVNYHGNKTNPTRLNPPIVGQSASGNYHRRHQIIGDHEHNEASDMGELSNISYNRKLKSQRRSTEWVKNRSTVEQKRKFRALTAGYEKYRVKCIASAEDITNHVLRPQVQDDSKFY